MCYISGCYSLRGCGSEVPLPAPYNWLPAVGVHGYLASGSHCPGTASECTEYAKHTGEEGSDGLVENFPLDRGSPILRNAVCRSVRGWNFPAS